MILKRKTMTKETKKTTKKTPVKPAGAPDAATQKTDTPSKKTQKAASGVRIYDLAKELGLTSKETLSMLAELGFPGKVPSNAIDEQTAQVIRDLVHGGKKEEQKPLIKPSADEKAAPPGIEASAKPAPSEIKSEAPKHEEKPSASVSVPQTEEAPAAPPQEVKLEKPEEAPPVIDKKAHETPPAPTPVEEKLVEISLPLTLRDFSDAVKISPNTVIKDFLSLGMMLSINQTVDEEAANRWAKLHNILLVVKTKGESVLDDDEIGRDEDLRPRPPFVTVMGHVDHGKTKLLDAIRKSNVADREAGGITQHIGAYKVWKNDRTIVFLDTPGHEAFTAMRARGAKITDIVVLVVAADDGVMPQTIEAIHHAKAAKVPIIVAINKVDKPDINVDRIKRQIADQGLVPEEWGGETVCVPVSAKYIKGIEELLEMICLQADMLELKSNPVMRARGAVVEAKLDKGKGPVATVLIHRGTMRVGDVVVVGQTWGRVRAMLDDHFERVEQALPGDPVEVLGLSSVPQAGDVLYAVDDDKTAKKIIDKIKQQTQLQKSLLRVSLKDLYNQIKEGKIKELNLVLKVDVQGSLEAIEQALSSLPQEKVRLHVIHGAVGDITETDIMLATASNAICIGFHTKATVKAVKQAELENVEIKTYEIIYNLIEEMKAAMEGLLEPQYEESIIGTAKVLDTFRIPKIGTIAGCIIQDGLAKRGSSVRVKRENEMLYKGKIETLKRFKEDVREVQSGYECGIYVSSFNDYKAGDILEIFETKEVKSELVSTVKDGRGNL